MIRDEKGTAAGSDGDDVSFVRVLNVILRRRRLILLVPMVLVVAAAVFRLSLPRQYTSSSTFMPQRNDATPQGFGGLAAQLGISVPGSSPAESPAFYTELIRSRAILEPTLETPVPAAEGSGTVPLRTLYRIRAPGPLVERESALRKLRQQVGVSTSRTTDIVTLSVSAPSPQAAQTVSNRIIELVNEFNLESRQTQAREERRFVESRRSESRVELSEAEAELAQFLARNAQFARSPHLTLEHERLQREVGWRQQVFTSLAQSFEQARIEEVRSTPVITIIESPTLPIRPDGRGTTRWVIMAFAFGLLISLPLAFVLEFFRNSRGVESDDFHEFARLRHETALDLRRPWRVFAGGKSSR